MATVFQLLPQPVGSYDTYSDGKVAEERAAALAAKAFRPPPYGQRGQFVPRKVEDYGDGGAFPECHVAQYPLNMGRPGADGASASSSSSAIVPTYTDADGVVQYDAILGGGSGTGGGRIKSQFTDLIEKKLAPERLRRPDDEAVAANTNATLAAMNMIVAKKVASSLPVKHPTDGATQAARDHEFVRYTPKPDAPGYNPNCKQRIIRMVDMPVDPMQPPKFEHKKLPPGPPPPPVPLMRSPPRKVTAEDQKNWKIPPCISNWKNARGYTIPLDKRLAADGRGLQETSINHKFAKIAEALYQVGGDMRGGGWGRSYSSRPTFDSLVLEAMPQWPLPSPSPPPPSPPPTTTTTHHHTHTRARRVYLLPSASSLFCASGRERRSRGGELPVQVEEEAAAAAKAFGGGAAAGQGPADPRAAGTNGSWRRRSRWRRQSQRPGLVLFRLFFRFVLLRLGQRLGFQRRRRRLHQARRAAYRSATNTCAP
jgi:hypothetical protein